MPPKTKPAVKKTRLSKKMTLKLVKSIKISHGYILSSCLNEKIWLFLSRDGSLIAIDPEAYTLRYTNKLPGDGTYSMVTMSGELCFVNRYIDKVFTILAFELQTGREVWRTALPISLGFITQVFITTRLAGLYVFIKNQLFHLQQTNGELLQHKQLVSEVKGVHRSAHRMYLRLNEEFGYLQNNLDFVRLLDSYVFKVAMAHGRVYCLLRKERKIVVLADESATVSASFSTVENTGIPIDLITDIAPLSMDNNRIAVLLKDSDIAAVVNLTAKAVEWKSRLKKKFLRPDGFGPSQILNAANGLVIVLYSIGSDEQAAIFCNAVTGAEEFFFGKSKGHFFSTDDRIVMCADKIRVYQRGEGVPKLSGFLTIERKKD